MKGLGPQSSSVAHTDSALSVRVESHFTIWLELLILLLGVESAPLSEASRDASGDDEFSIGEELALDDEVGGEGVDSDEAWRGGQNEGDCDGNGGDDGWGGGGVGKITSATATRAQLSGSVDICTTVIV